MSQYLAGSDGQDNRHIQFVHYFASVVSVLQACDVYAAANLLQMPIRGIYELRTKRTPSTYMGSFCASSRIGKRVHIQRLAHIIQV